MSVYTKKKKKFERNGDGGRAEPVAAVGRRRVHGGEKEEGREGGHLQTQRESATCVDGLCVCVSCLRASLAGSGTHLQ